eukprot:2831537-Lingulodinium_polyedra.AAC.1
MYGRGQARCLWFGVVSAQGGRLSPGMRRPSPITPRRGSSVAKFGTSWPWYVQLFSSRDSWAIHGF